MMTILALFAAALIAGLLAVGVAWLVDSVLHGHRVATHQ